MTGRQALQRSEADQRGVIPPFVVAAIGHQRLLDLTDLRAERMIEAGFDEGRLHLLKHAAAKEQIAEIARSVADGTVIWGTGNFRGAGAEITAFANASVRSC